MLDRINMILGYKLPRLVVAQRVIDKMVAAAHDYVQDETGEAMVGLVMPDPNGGAPTLYVLDTIAPDDSAVREAHTFQQGDARQDEILYWLRENWRVIRTKRARSYGRAVSAKWDVPLRYLGDWHKQPGFMIQPSGGDLMTALDWIHDRENGMEFLLAPILTMGHPPTTENDEEGNFITVEQPNGTCVRIDFWYIARGIPIFQAIVPHLEEDEHFPRLQSYPWHLVNEARYQREVMAMERDGLFNSLLLWDADDKPPLEVCFMVARVGSPKVMLVITPHDYPSGRPHIRVAPFLNMGAGDDLYDVFEDMWAQSNLFHDVDGWAWDAEMTLVEYIHVVEDELGIERTAPPPPPEAVTETVADPEPEAGGEAEHAEHEEVEQPSEEAE